MYRTHERKLPMLPNRDLNAYVFDTWNEDTQASFRKHLKSGTSLKLCERRRTM